jgi:hypothetical protein
MLRKLLRIGLAGLAAWIMSREKKKKRNKKTKINVIETVKCRASKLAPNKKEKNPVRAHEEGTTDGRAGAGGGWRAGGGDGRSFFLKRKIFFFFFFYILPPKNTSMFYKRGRATRPPAAGGADRAAGRIFFHRVTPDYFA